MIKIDEELKALIPPLTDEEYNQLEQNILKEGIREPIIVWPADFNDGDYYEEFIVDGHNRHSIALKHNLNYNVVKKEFESRKEVVEWMILNQFGRRNLSAYQRSLLALKLKPVFEEKAKENQGVRNDICQKSDRSIDTKKELSKIANVSHDTIAKVQKIEDKAPAVLKDKILKGDISINKGHKMVGELQFVPVEDVDEFVEKRIQEIEDKKKNKFAKVAKKIQENKIEKQSDINEKIHESINAKFGEVYEITGNKTHYLIVNDSFNVEEIKKTAKNIDCVLTDPPYGINYKSPSGSGLAQRGDYKVIENDDKDFNPSILFEYSDNVITWGGNHYANKLNNSAGWLVWDKRDGVQINNNSDCEMAWTNMINSARLFHHKWNGMIKDSERGEKRIHPTQKPVKLFEWCLEICECGENVLDLFAGSGITVIACDNTNRNAFIVEKDEVFASATLNRFIQKGYEVKKHEQQFH
jgi:site-specific DNA-methyltransferase (adenine-specific)